jgi:hypothetical protein
MNENTGTDALHLGNTLDRMPIYVLNFPLTETETVLLAAARHVKFGELQNVELVAGEQKVLKKLSPQQKACIEKLRTEGITYIHRVIVHNGYPMQAEISGKFFGVKYQRKIRFTQ